MTRHTAHFSHEFDDGPSGPARSYWDIRRDGRTVLTVCLHPRKDMSITTAETVARAFDECFIDGRTDKINQIQRVLGINS